MNVEVDTDLLEKAKGVVNGPQNAQAIIEAALIYYIEMKLGRKWATSDVESFANRIESLNSEDKFTVKDLFDDWEGLNSSSQKVLGRELSEYSKSNPQKIKKSVKEKTNLQTYIKI